VWGNWDTADKTVVTKTVENMLSNKVAVQQYLWIGLHQHSGSVLEGHSVSTGKQCATEMKEF
jgi:hypothetical protein